MRKVREWILRFGGLWNKQRRDRELDDEIQSHLQLHIEDNLRLGMTPDQARREAMIKLGGIESMKESYRDQRGLPVLETLWQDIRYGARMLRKNPGFTAVAVLTLALGIGANTAIFSVVNAVLLRPLPYPEPGRLVQLRADWSGKSGIEIGSVTFVEVKAQSQSLARIAAYTGGDMTLTGAGSAERVVAGAVTADFFPLLGVQPALGRNFTREEDTPNGPKAAILGHGLWQSRFGGDAGVLGRTITLNQQSYTIVGILPAHFQYPEPFQLWTPLALGETGAGGGGTFAKYGEGMFLLKAIARLKPGVALEQAQTELQTIAQRIQQGGPTATPGGNPGPRGEGGEGGGRGGRGESVLTLVGLHEQVVGDVKGALLVLLGAVVLVLLIACANVANLLLARAATRQKEMAVRTALGAGRWRVARQLLTESLLLSLAGGGLGLLMAFWSVRALGQWSGASLPAMHGIGIDAWVLAFTFGVAVITGLVFGLAPIFQASRMDVNAALKEEGRGDTGGHRNQLRHLLVVSEVALALVLLVGAGLLIKSFSRLMDVNPGFRTDGVLTFQVTLTEGKSSPQRVNFIEQILERLKPLPGVQAAAATDSLPLTDFARITPAQIEGRPPIDFRKAKPGEVRPASRPTVTLDYFNAMGIQVRNGRAFTSQDARPGAGTVIVNEAFEKHHFPGESAVGKRIRLGGPWLTVVGVVNDVRQKGLARDVMLEVYTPVLDDIGDEMSFVIRTSGEPAHLISAVRATLAEVEPNQALHNVMTMEQRLANTTTSRRLNTALLGSFAGVALLLAVVGIYGVTSYAVTQRRREIGVRMALGAQKSDVLSLIIHGGLRLTLLGVAIGLAGAFALTRYLSSLLYSVKATDPLTFLGIALALTGVAMLACWLPARRAAKVHPMVALRYE